MLYDGAALRLTSLLTPVLVPALVCGAVAGCASSLKRADRLFDARAFAQAASAYETALAGDSGQSGLDRALFRLALVHALPASPVHDERRARELFEELTRRFDESPYSFEAALIMELEDRDRRLRDEAERQRREIAELEAESARRGEDADELRTTLSELNQKLERLGKEIGECEKQLERLKAIDLDGSL